jgi:hypothetical protein
MEEKNITDRVKSYEDACHELGEQPIVDWGDDTPDEIAYKKLKKIIQVLNEGWAPNFINGGNLKWTPRFKTSGRLFFVFDDSDFGYMYPPTGRPSRFFLKGKELSDYAGKQFLNLWKDFIL